MPLKYMKKEAKKLKEDYIRQIKRQYSWEIMDVPVEIAIRLVFGDRRRRDWDNRHKLSMDALEWIILKDDSQIEKAYVEKFYEKWTWGIWIFIKELKNFDPALPSEYKVI